MAAFEVPLLGKLLETPVVRSLQRLNNYGLSPEGYRTAIELLAETSELSQAQTHLRREPVLREITRIVKDITENPDDQNNSVCLSAAERDPQYHKFHTNWVIEFTNNALDRARATRRQGTDLRDFNGNTRKEVSEIAMRVLRVEMRSILSHPEDRRYRGVASDGRNMRRFNVFRPADSRDFEERGRSTLFQ